MRTSKNIQPSQQKQQQYISSPIQPTQKRIYQTIYGSRFMRNSKQLVPICNNTSNVSTNAKINSTVRSSSDYYTFQQSMINAKVKNNSNLHYPTHKRDNNTVRNYNPINAINAINNINNNNNIHHHSPPSPSTNPQTFRKTYSIQKPSTSRPVLQRSSNSKLTGVGTVKIQRKSISCINSPTNPTHIKNMNNTTTRFNINKTNNTQKNLISYAMNNTTSNFRPMTNNNQRKFNNNAYLAEDFKNYLSKYEIIRELGKGTYGVVHLARNKIEQRLKNKDKMEQNRSQNFQQQFLSAYNVLKQQQRKDDILKQSIKKQSIQVQNKQIGQNRYNRQNPQNCNISLDQINNNITVDHNNDQQHTHENRSQSSPYKLQQKQQKQQKQQSTCQNLHKIPQTKTIQYSKQTTTLYAIKIYQKFKVSKDPTKFKNIRKQINIMQNIDHPNIIKLYQSVDTLTKINLVVQYGGNLSLLDYLKQNYPLSQKTMRNIGKQLLSAIVYLHDKNIVHRDLKLQNVLMMQDKVKIIDFGFSTLTYKNRKLNAICGTPNYMAPQLLSKKQYIGEYADIWSYGVVMYTIAEGRHPFKADNYNQLDRLVNKGVYQFKRITNPVHQAFIKRILKVKPQERPNGKELLGHPWLNISQEADDMPDE